MYNPESPEIKESGRRKISVDLTREQIASLKLGDKIQVSVIGDDQQLYPKEIRITQVTEVGEFYSIEGETKAKASGGGSLVTLEINPSDPQANEIIF